MDTPFLAMIMIFAGNFAPRGWALCWGQIMSIAQNTALFSLLGTTYGGDGQVTFGLPDLRGRMPIGQGQGPGLPLVNLGEVAGTPTTTLLTTNMPMHNHTGVIAAGGQAIMPATAQAGTSAVPGNTLAAAKLPTIGSGPTAQAIKGYGTSDGTTTLAPGTISGNVTIGIAGGSQPFSIMNPYLGINYCVALEGIFPSRN
ncbi:phage tail protein [Chitinophaga parva]|uniref:Phage tail protein n=2 Tax=Chitinophaga parva TaxID=2169414 RepID=A0A2T7BC85_9BACT|nr:phage tail protein [Chitinophaga parva]